MEPMEPRHVELLWRSTLEYTRVSMHKDMANVPSGHLVRATTDDREHQLWVAATASEKNKLKPEELEILNLGLGELHEITNPCDPIRGSR